MSSFFPTPRHAAQSSSAAVKFCLLAVLCTVLAGVLAIFPALLIIDCHGNLESEECDTSTGVLLAFLSTLIFLSLCASCALYLCVSAACLMNRKEKPSTRQQSDISYFRSPVSGGEAVRFSSAPDIRAMHGQHHRSREFTPLSTIQSAQSAMDEHPPASSSSSAHLSDSSHDRDAGTAAAGAAGGGSIVDEEGFSRGGAAQPISTLQPALSPP